MNMTGIIIAAAVVGIVGIVIGVLLGIASEKFKVEVDEKEILVRAELPGNNCGGCGYAGCDALAKAIAEGIKDYVWQNKPKLSWLNKHNKIIFEKIS